jgi:hypothetical protein
MSRIAPVLLLIVTMFARPVLSQEAEPEVPEANPGRPTVSTPATLTPVGYLQFETGFTGASHSAEFTRRYSFNEAIKFSPTSRLELLVTGEPIAHSTADGTSGNKVADIFVGAQAVVVHGEAAKPTLAVSYFHRAYDGGAPEFDFGSPTNSALVLASADVKGFQYDANAFFTALEQQPIRRAQFGQSLTISHPVTRRFTVSGEIWHFTQPFLRSNAIGNLWAVSYTVRKTLVIDAGFNRGLTDTATRWEMFAGFTYLLPRRFWARH